MYKYPTDLLKNKVALSLSEKVNPVEVLVTLWTNQFLSLRTEKS